MKITQSRLRQIIKEELEFVISEQKLQRVDWSNYKGLDKAAQDVWKQASAYMKKWEALERPLRDKFFDATIGNAEGTVSKEDYNKIAAEHDKALDAVGPMFVKMWETFTDAGYVPPQAVVQGANDYRTKQNPDIVDSIANIRKKAALQMKAKLEKAGASPEVQQSLTNTLIYKDEPQ